MCARERRSERGERGAYISTSVNYFEKFVCCSVEEVDFAPPTSPLTPALEHAKKGPVSSKNRNI